MSVSQTNATRLRVLIVDDYRDSADTLATLVQHAGYETAVAYDGIDALEAAQRFAPHVVLLDINMPRMDGYAVARVLRRTSPAALFLVAHSAQGAQQDIDDAYAAGFDRHLLKPMEPTTLLALLQDEFSRLERVVNRNESVARV